MVAQSGFNQLKPRYTGPNIGASLFIGAACIASFAAGALMVDRRHDARVRTLQSRLSVISLRSESHSGVLLKRVEELRAKLKELEGRVIRGERFRPVGAPAGDSK